MRAVRRCVTAGLMPQPPPSSRWHEERIVVDPDDDGGCAASNVAHGRSVIVIPDFCAASERATLLSSAFSEAAASGESLVSSDRGPSAAQSNAGRLRLHIPERLEANCQSLSDVLIRRALAFVQEELPLAGEQMLDCRAADLHELLDAAPGLEYSPGEPAVNVYTASGEFKPHEDKMGLTILITLSDSDEFTGGGTAFWRPADFNDARRGRAEPALVLKPPAGSALLFGGEVTHAGRRVESGTRCMFVASFSRKKAHAQDPSSTAAHTAPPDHETDLGAFLDALS